MQRVRGSCGAPGARPSGMVYGPGRSSLRQRTLAGLFAVLLKAGNLWAQSAQAAPPVTPVTPVAYGTEGQGVVAIRRPVTPLAILAPRSDQGVDTAGVAAGVVAGVGRVIGSPAGSLGAPALLRADPSRGPAPWWAPVASLAIPGSGQFALRQQRSVAYLVAEVFLLVQYVSAQRDGDRERTAYRELAKNVARKPFGGTQPGTWDYYERLEQFLESGAYDRIPGGGLDPELDASTFNGARWRLARETFWRNPDVAPAVSSAEYQRALDFYRRTAVGEAFRWSWFDATLEQDVYVQTIRSANRSYQRAVNVLGAVAMNHLASLIDGYVSVRIRRYGGVQVAGFTLDGLQVTYQPALGAPVGSMQTGLRFTR